VGSVSAERIVIAGESLVQLGYTGFAADELAPIAAGRP
jgi:hypothetical protein